MKEEVRDEEGCRKSDDLTAHHLHEFCEREERNE